MKFPEVGSLKAGGPYLEVLTRKSNSEVSDFPGWQVFQFKKEAAGLCKSIAYSAEPDIVYEECRSSVTGTLLFVPFHVAI